MQGAVILSEAKNLSLFLFLYSNRREILRFAQNDKTRHFFRSLFSRDKNAFFCSALAADVFAWLPNLQGLKPISPNC
jgi:hypothetical protein